MSLPVPHELPLLPVPRSRAMLVLWNPDAELKDFVSVVEGDPALTAAVLRAANSAISAPVTPLHSAHVAIVRIGFAAVKQIMSAAILQTEFERLQGSLLDTTELWHHLLATGLLAETLSTSEADRSLAFTAGLLHDIGRLAFAAQHPARYGKVIEMARAGVDVEEAERRLFGASHTSWGARVSEAWGLPQEISAAVAAHHDDAASGLPRAVYEARKTAWALGFGDGLTYPEQISFDETSDQASAVNALGGRDGLFARIQWYREAVEPR